MKTLKIFAVMLLIVPCVALSACGKVEWQKFRFWEKSNAQNNTGNDQVPTLQSQIASLNAQIAELQNAIVGLGAEHGAERVALQNQIAELNAEIYRLENQAYLSSVLEYALTAGGGSPYYSPYINFQDKESNPAVVFLNPEVDKNTITTLDLTHIPEYINGYPVRILYITQGCNNLTTVNIPSHIIYISQLSGAFTNFVIPNHVTELGNYAFGSCQNLVNIFVPRSVAVTNSFYSFPNRVGVNIFIEHDEMPSTWSQYTFGTGTVVSNIIWGATYQDYLNAVGGE